VLLLCSAAFGKHYALPRAGEEQQHITQRREVAGPSLLQDRFSHIEGLDRIASASNSIDHVQDIFGNRRTFDDPVESMIATTGLRSDSRAGGSFHTNSVAHGNTSNTEANDQERPAIWFRN
jgi:hypothetical protein